ncbi:hypothetical protein D9757_004903 [Collybiopsis confluens]|uniref:Uncharacterized protein n=1 Tax=Collybiopsis confluens TaxID=2823264 RepID=A0A8H5MCQ3_9AGAR|nr:hypothetical protein D9757_004903 [Collybiopsis confluens]
MDRFFSPLTPEAVAYSHISQNSYDWDIHHLDVDEALVAGCAAYDAFDRYLRKEDLFILPRTRSELQSVLKRYSYDSIHNAISKSRSTLQPGVTAESANLQRIQFELSSTPAIILLSSFAYTVPPLLPTATMNSAPPRPLNQTDYAPI